MDKFLSIMSFMSPAAMLIKLFMGHKGTPKGTTDGVSQALKPKAEYPVGNQFANV